MLSHHRHAQSHARPCGCLPTRLRCPLGESVEQQRSGEGGFGLVAEAHDRWCMPQPCRRLHSSLSPPFRVPLCATATLPPPPLSTCWRPHATPEAPPLVATALYSGYGVGWGWGGGFSPPSPGILTPHPPLPVPPPPASPHPFRLAPFVHHTCAPEGAVHP